MKEGRENIKIRAIFFDWINTLAHIEPDWQDIFCQAYRKFGIRLSSQKVLRGIYEAEAQIPTGRSMRWHESGDARVHIRYQKVVLANAGADIPGDKVIVRAMKELNRLYRGTSFVLFDDVLSALGALKECGLTLGVISNMHRDMHPVCDELGLKPYLDFVITSAEVGATKPDPAIFLAALNQAKVPASRMIYVGDHYRVDVRGAMGVGINPILIDRYDLFPDFTGCPRIGTLSELVDYL